MLHRDAVIEKARELGFADTGFTDASPFREHREFLEAHREEYSWCESAGFSLLEGTDPGSALPGAKSIIVLLENYCRTSFPASMTGNFGRCYLDDDRVTKDGLAVRVKAFRSFLRDAGIGSKVPFNLPHRMAAARAGLGTFGKNCLFFAGRAARGSSWVLPLTVVTDAAFEPDAPTIRKGCPDWCRNACVAACPTRALRGDGTLDPRKCISYLSYYGSGLTPLDMREPMGTCVYGCDRCQNVCPRNAAWAAQDLPPSPRVEAKASGFALDRLLRMDEAYFAAKIQPHMFYMSVRDIWRWKMNAARAMGNSLDDRYIPDLSRALREEPDERVRIMAAWALGRIGGGRAREALTSLAGPVPDALRGEIALALDQASR